MEFRFKHCRVRIFSEPSASVHVVTRFDDGREVHAIPMMDAESIERAHELGYGGTDHHAVCEMTRWHDLLHTVVAEAQGEPWSPTLYAVAHGYELAPGVVEREERLVLFVQRALSQGVGLLLAARVVR